MHASSISPGAAAEISVVKARRCQGEPVRPVAGKGRDDRIGAPRCEDVRVTSDPVSASRDDHVPLRIAVGPAGAALR